ncbi:cell division protein PerM [Demequina sp.]|uniref:cell division protein PerM n=1 Tax=Demequina sp. TaxID=2050685 RepID=UPI003D0F43A7
MSEHPRSRLQSLFAGAPGWVGGVLTGVQSAVIGLIVIITPAFAAAAAAPTGNGSAAIDWMGVTQLSVRLWLMAHGVPFYVEGVAFTLVPLGMTALCVAIIAAIARRFCTKSWASWAVATGTYVGLVTLAEVAAMRGFPNLAATTARTVAVSLLIAGPAVAAGIWRAYGAEFGWVPRVPATLRRGLRLGVATAAAALGAAALVGAAFTYLGRGRIAEAGAALGIDPLGGVALAFGQALYAPNISIWMVGWMTGLGFSVGEGTSYAPGEIAADAVPAFPIFGALPTVEGGWLVWAPLAIVVLAAAARIALRRRITTELAHLPAVGAAVATAAVTMAALGALATGALGPGRLEFVGVEVLPVAVLFGVLAAVGYGVGHGLLLLGGLVRKGRDTAPRLSVVPDPEPVATP